MGNRILPYIEQSNHHKGKDTAILPRRNHSVPPTTVEVTAVHLSAGLLFLTVVLAVILFLGDVWNPREEKRSLGSPAPTPRARKVRPDLTHPIVPGVYDLKWGGRSFEMTLTEKGVYTCKAIWEGSWRWDTERRILSIYETTDKGKTWGYWEAKLDREWKGIATVWPRKDEPRDRQQQVWVQLELIPFLPRPPLKPEVQLQQRDNSFLAARLASCPQ